MDEEAESIRAKLNSTRNRLLNFEMIRVIIASCALVIIGIGTLIYLAFTISKKEFSLSWEAISLLGFATLCFALPLFQRIAVGKDGGELEVRSSIDLIEQRLEEQGVEAKAARTDLFEETRQQIGGISAQIRELTDGFDRLAQLPQIPGHDGSIGKPRIMSVGAGEIEPTEPTLREIRKNLPKPIDEDDPQKGRFGGLEEQDGRRIVASVKNSSFGSQWKKVLLRVETTNGKALKGKFVYFFLHDSFEPDEYRIKVDKSGQFAELELQSYGGFTAGAVADCGITLLEIDLATSENVKAPKAWRER